jgi:hypothetical protein
MRWEKEQEYQRPYQVSQECGQLMPTKSCAMVSYPKGSARATDRKARRDLGQIAAGALVTLMISVRDNLRLCESGRKSKISEVKRHVQNIPSEGVII